MNEQHPDYTDDPNFRTAHLGVEAESFANSVLGQGLIARCERDIEAAYKDLAVVKPDDTAEIIRLQQVIAVARYVPQYLQEVIQAGRIAEDRLHDYDNAVVEDED